MIDKPFLRIKDRNFPLYLDFLYTLNASVPVGVTYSHSRQMAVANESHTVTHLINLYVQGTVKSQHYCTGGGGHCISEVTEMCLLESENLQY